MEIEKLIITQFEIDTNCVTGTSGKININKRKRLDGARYFSDISDFISIEGLTHIWGDFHSDMESLSNRYDDVDVKRILFLSELPDSLIDAVCIENLDNYESDLPISPETGLFYESLQKEIDHALSTITEREAEVVRLYYGLDDGAPMTLEEIGMKYDLTRERVRQIKEKAIRRLMHTRRNKILKSFIN